MQNQHREDKAKIVETGILLWLRFHLISLCFTISRSLLTLIDFVIDFDIIRLRQVNGCCRLRIWCVAPCLLISDSCLFEVSDIAFKIILVLIVQLHVLLLSLAETDVQIAKLLILIIVIKIIGILLVYVFPVIGFVCTHFNSYNYKYE